MYDLCQIFHSTLWGEFLRGGRRAAANGLRLLGLSRHSPVQLPFAIPNLFHRRKPARATNPIAERITELGSGMASATVRSIRQVHVVFATSPPDASIIVSRQVPLAGDPVRNPMLNN